MYKNAEKPVQKIKKKQNLEKTSIGNQRQLLIRDFVSFEGLYTDSTVIWLRCCPKGLGCHTRGNPVYLLLHECEMKVVQVNVVFCNMLFFIYRMGLVRMHQSLSDDCVAEWLPLLLSVLNLNFKKAIEHFLFYHLKNLHD